MVNLSAGKDYHGSIAEAKNKDDPVVVGDFVVPEEDNVNGGEGSSRGWVDASGQPWGDWACLNPSCGNVNLGFRSECKKCRRARPFGVSGRSSCRGGRGRGPGADYSGGRGPAGLSGPNDVACLMANPSNGTVYVCNFPEGTDENMLAKHFGAIGEFKRDNRTGWDKVTNEPKGDAPITYKDPFTAETIADFTKKDKVLNNSGQQMIPVEDPIVVGGEGRGRGENHGSGRKTGHV